MPRAVVMNEAPKEESFLDKCCVQMDKPKPSGLMDDEVLVEMKLRPVNPADILVLKGQYMDFHPGRFPATPGTEGCGVVADVGKNVKNVKIGDRVQPFIAEYSYSGEGSWQDFVKVKAEDCVEIPHDIPDEFAAQAFVNPWTVCGVMDVLNVPKGECLLMSAANSALGKELIAYAKKNGIKTIGLVRRDSAKDEVKQLGAEMVLTMGTDDVYKKVMDATGCKGAYAAVDPVCGETTKMLAQCTRDKGTVLVFGNLCGEDMHVSPFDLIFRDVRIEGFYVSRWMHSKFPDAKSRNEFCNKIFQLYREGVFKPMTGSKFKLQEFEQAVKASMDEGKKGKVLLVS